MKCWIPWCVPSTVPPGVDDVSLPVRQPVSEELGSSSLGDKANIGGVRLVGHGKAPALGLLAHLVFGGHGSEREQAVAKVVLAEYAQHIGLILAGVRSPVQPDAAVRGGLETGVVASGDRVEALRDPATQQSPELDLPVAPQAGVGGASGRIGSREIVQDTVFETIPQIPPHQPDTHGVSDGPGIARLGDRAGTKQQVDPHGLMPGLHHTGRGDCGIHSPRQGNCYAHVRSPLRLDDGPAGDGLLDSSVRSTSAAGQQAGHYGRRRSAHGRRVVDKLNSRRGPLPWHHAALP